jgi:cytochrome c553
MKKIVILISLVLLFGCNKKPDSSECESESKTKSDKKFEMYQMSEMAALMESMYLENQQLKERIKKGDTIGKFPSHFLQIHKAVMTDETENDAFFKEQSALFIKAQELIYEDPKNAKQHFNDGINACVRCHEVKCGGPLPKIKKLYIK